jgi:tetrahydromethanopterin S-methyltransferase subunit A
MRTSRHELEAGIELTKCQQCGCMEDTLKQMATVLPTLSTTDGSALVKSMMDALAYMRPIKYPCLGCEHCYPAVASNTSSLAFPALDQLIDVACDFQMNETQWPPVVGEYVVVDQDAPVAVSTLASVELVNALAQCQPDGLAIVGKTETENIGLDKVVTNMITNPNLRYLIVAGVDPQGHYPGQTLLALAEHGVDDKGRVQGSPGNLERIWMEKSVCYEQVWSDFALFENVP